MGNFECHSQQNFSQEKVWREILSFRIEKYIRNSREFDHIPGKFAVFSSCGPQPLKTCLLLESTFLQNRKNLAWNKANMSSCSLNRFIWTGIVEHYIVNICFSSPITTINNWTWKTYFHNIMISCLCKQMAQWPLCNFNNRMP